MARAWTTKGESWEELSSVKREWGLPWCVLGDFNVTRFVEDRNRQGPTSAAMEEFSDWIDQEELMELPLANQAYTWSNLWEDPSLAKLDRVLIDHGWEEGATTLFWSSRGSTGYWEVKLRRAVRAEEVDQYLELLEILRQQELSPDCPDVVTWRPAVSKDFSVKSGYSWLRRDRSPLRKTLTRSRLARWVSRLPEECGLCGVEVESPDHLFTSCVVVRGTWERLKAATAMEVEFNDLEGMWSAGKALRDRGDRSIQAKVSQLFVPAMVWATWLTRNQAIFSGRRPNGENMWEMVKGFIRDWGMYCVGVGG
ncbi:hypothetical protein QJS10_CPB12g00740 [Acorus calamus]|uniref:Reverse transcriptase zinc-binding domain-containing protein n=1 Tax=Acorus calamus TaxID=4465 RepID=A0AAV9DN04_ACOCL|nr:hypothetical protein QJS10_CPB12g00740 [Acorus calamus]